MWASVILLSVILWTTSARELDPATCMSRFDVQKDKIIRTEESQEMGAHYISELDVGARDECLRLCCETDRCDVFVYEEKSPGSCYLFNCGPPEDFRCKFTAHGNFSSGVLALSRSLAELQDLETLNQHERDLVKLRVQTTTTTKAPTTPPPTLPPAPPPPPDPPQAPRKFIPTRRCSRYQFECHTGGECIAVYNACDGIPQCADGSDEAPELGCPAHHTLAPQIYRPPKLQENLAESVVSSEAASEAIQEPRTPHWPHRLVQAQPPLHYADNNPSSHIFSHKGGLMQENDGSGMPGNIVQPYPAFEAPWQRRPWNGPANGMDGMSGVPGAMRPGTYSRYRDWGDTEPQRGWPVPQPPPRDIPDMPVYMQPKTMPETPIVYSSQQETLRDSPKKGFDLIPKKPPVESHVTEPSVEAKVTSNDVLVQVAAQKPKDAVTDKTKKKDLNNQTPAPHKLSSEVLPKKKEDEEVTRHSMQHERYEMTPDDHEGISEHPPAAVLLLVLGILMTTVMVVMLGCRLRLARRRLRRGKSPFAHDADYLVNGMYL